MQGPEPAQIMKVLNHMSSTVERLDQALQGTALEGAPISEKWPSSSADSLLVVELPSDTILEGWEILRDLVNETGRYPLVTRVEDIDGLFLDEPPHESDLAGGDYAETVIQESQNVDGGKELRDGKILRRNFSPLRSNDLFNWLHKPVEHPGHILAGTLRRFGSLPDVADILSLQASGVLATDADLERWLLRWEVDRFGEAAIAPESTGILEWSDFSDGADYVAVLPSTPNSWEGLACMGWYGLGHNAAIKVAALRSWHERFGAELVCAFSTVLQLQVRRRAVDLEEALDLAIEQHHFAPDARILSGVSLREHARALFSGNRWVFLAKP